MTHSIQHPITPAPRSEFSANELSLADTLVLDMGVNGKEHPPLIMGFYLATKCFREKIPFKLWSERWSQPLIESDGSSVLVHPAIQLFVSEFDMVLKYEQQVGVRLVQPPPESKPEYVEQQVPSEDGTPSEVEASPAPAQTEPTPSEQEGATGIAAEPTPLDDLLRKPAQGSQSQNNQQRRRNR